ncbi:hypothetical protein AB0K51_05585 [Kitasatospora sp. NPDC049285]|uniref:hypothetical protein n=1 Tax=Kitasatospora sp. NPDC049285 TaxID=3157096 RepID=UPI003432A61F
MKNTPPGYTVCVEGVTEAASFRALADALTSLWAVLRTLPLGWTQYEAYRYFFGPGAPERTAAFLARDGQLLLTAALLGRSHLIRVTPGHPGPGPLRLEPGPLKLLATAEVRSLWRGEAEPPRPEQRSSG